MAFLATTKCSQSHAQKFLGYSCLCKLVKRISVHCRLIYSMTTIFIIIIYVSRDFRKECISPTFLLCIELSGSCYILLSLLLVQAFISWSLNKWLKLIFGCWGWCNKFKRFNFAPLLWKKKQLIQSQFFCCSLHESQDKDSVITWNTSEYETAGIFSNPS